MVLPKEVSGRRGCHITLVQVLAVHAEAEHDLVGTILPTVAHPARNVRQFARGRAHATQRVKVGYSLAGPRRGWEALHARGKCAIDREETLIRLGKRPLLLLGQVPVVIRVLWQAQGQR